MVMRLGCKINRSGKVLLFYCKIAADSTNVDERVTPFDRNEWKLSIESARDPKTRLCQLPRTGRWRPIAQKLDDFRLAANDVVLKSDLNGYFPIIFNGLEQGSQQMPCSTPTERLLTHLTPILLRTTGRQLTECPAQVRRDDAIER